MSLSAPVSASISVSFLKHFIFLKDFPCEVPAVGFVQKSLCATTLRKAHPARFILPLRLFRNFLQQAWC